MVAELVDPVAVAPQPAAAAPAVLAFPLLVASRPVAPLPRDPARVIVVSLVGQIVVVVVAETVVVPVVGVRLLAALARLGPALRLQRIVVASAPKQATSGPVQ